MKFLFEFAPIVIFFLVYKLYGLYFAILAMIVATMLQLIYTKIKNGKFEKTHLFTFILLVFFGGITLILRDPAFVMWKVSIFYVAFSLALIASIWIGDKTLAEHMLGREFILPKKIWNNITWLWGLVFIVIAIINSYFVIIALNARDAFFNISGLDKKMDLSNIECINNNFQDLCIIAQTSEQSWVNFKLFGTLGITILLIIFTVFILGKYLKEQKS